MRTLLAFFVFAFVGNTNLTGQVIPPPAIPKRPAPQSNVYLVTFRQNTPASQRAAVLQANSARLRISYRAVNAASVEVPEAAVLARLRNDPRVLSVVPSRSISLLGQGRGGGGGGGGGSKPKQPLNLTAVAASSSQINLSWTDDSNNESGFSIERCAGSGCANFTEIASVGANVTIFNSAGLAPQTLYRYRVAAFNGAGSSKYSNIAEATTPAPPPPAAPTNLTASVVSSSQINLSWSDNSNNEDGFRIEQCAGEIASCTDANFVQLVQVGANVTSYNNTGLPPQTTYTYRVRAFSSAGASAYSNSVQAATLPPPPQPPSAPSNLTAAAVSSSQINLSWSDTSSNEDGFQVERCMGALADCAGGGFIQLPPLSPNVTGLSDAGLLAQTTYTYRVRAFNSAGSSAYSNSVQAATLAPPPQPPAAPGNLTMTVVSYNQINLNWSDNSNNESGFWVERCTGPGCTNFTQIAQLGPNTAAFNNAGLRPQTTYTYRVRAFNTAGSSAYSNSVQGVTPAAPPSTQVVPSGVQRIGAAPGALTWTGAGVGVAVVDTGLDFNHQDLGLAPEIQGVNAFNAYGGSCQDFYGHGTHVGGIIAARDNTIDVVGVAPNATLYCVTVFEPDPVEGATGTDEALMAGLDWIIANANVLTPRIRIVNMSLGREKQPEDDDPNNPLHLMVKALYDSGISVVVAAGNDPLREVTEQVPAGYPEVMAVASTTADAGVNGYDEFFPPCIGVPAIKADTASYFTTDGAFVGGRGVTVSAPGEAQEDIYSFEDACFLESIGIQSTALDGGVVELSGTSMASPHVAGVVALMWEKELSFGVDLAPEVARSRIRSSVARPGTAPLDSPLEEYTFDSEREGVVYAPAAVGDAPPPPQDFAPSVAIQSPVSGFSFPAGTSISFQGTATDAEDGNIAASLVWTSNRDGQIGVGAGFTKILSNGNHIITASLTDSGGNAASASVSISVGSSSIPATVQASSITYAMQGTRLLYTVKVVNEFGGPVSGATVEVDLLEWVFSGDLWISTATSDSQGNAHFVLDPADLGCYVTDIRNIVASGLTFVPGTPSNNFCNF